MSVNDKILDAIELLAKSSVERAGYDKTIQAQVIACQDKTIGKYKCKYQDAVFFAYVGNPDISLSNGSLVYILVPENDMSKDKTIIGTVEKLGTDYITIAEGEAAYEKVGVNSIEINAVDNYSYPFYLNTINPNYSYDIYNETRISYNPVLVNQQELKSYVNKSSSLIIAATIQTKSPFNKSLQGINLDYGIIFTVSFSDGTTKDYKLDVSNMVGDPYKLIIPTRQAVIFPINGADFIKVTKISIYNNYDVTQELENDPLDDGDILISDLEIYGANRLSEQQLNGVMITLITPDGSVFFNADAASLEKRIIAQIKEKGQKISSQGISFYWGLEDMNITSSSPKFNKYLGYGWQLIEGVTGDQLILKKQNIRCSKNRYKVVAIYDGNLITRQIDIENQSDNIPTITIESDSGIEFFNNTGSPTLTCTTTNATPASHRWGWANNGGYFEQAADVIGTVNGAVLSNIQILKIVNYADFKCTVYDNSGYLGTGSITLINEQNDKANYLTIVNGQAVYKYTQGGTAPNSKSLQNPQLIKALTFILRDGQGNVIYDGNTQDQSTLNSLFTEPNYVKWYIPNTNTLLIDQNGTPDEIIDDYNIYYNSHTIDYDIVSTFDYNKTNNQIRLEIFYSGIYVQLQTQFMFTKQGDIGTNGTEYIVKIIPNTAMNNPPQYPMITKIDGGNYIINYGIGTSTSQSQSMSSINNIKLLKSQLWRSGELVWEDGTSYDGVTNPTIEWSILTNKYSSSYSDDTDFTINSSTGVISYTDTLKNNANAAKACIIQCALSYESKVYYGTIPITTAWVSNSAYSINLKQNTGFRYVIYSADGSTPQYNSANPFEVEVTGVSGGSYSFNVIGGIKNASTGAYIANNPSHLTEITDNNNSLSNNQKKYKPIGKYDGQCVNNSIVCTYGSYAKIRIPIHFFLNRFGQGNINAWDGNSVQIDTNGGYILAPQMGAGVKDNNNKFTGVLMGKVREAGKTSTQIGFFGYASGARSFFLDSETGKTILGKYGASQITIDPSTNGQAKLYSGSFYNPNGTQAGNGLLINLTTPEIRYGNKNFIVDNLGAIKLGHYNITGSSTDYWNFSVDASGNVTLIGDLKAGKITNSSNYNFEVNNSATGNNPLIRAGYDSSSNSYNFIVEADGDVSLKGAITANSGKIGGINGWTIGYDNTVGSERGYIYSGNRTSLNSTASGLYVGTDGISAYKSGTGITFKVDSSGNVVVNGDITLGPNSSISWGALPNDVVAQGDLSTVAFSGDYEDLDNQPTIPILPSYIKSTYIDTTRIESPDIYAGHFYATGSESQATSNTGAAYYIYDGYSGGGDTGLGNQIGYICYDTGGSGSQGDWTQATKRVIFATKKTGSGAYNSYQTALKLKASGNMSLQAGYDIYSDYVNTSKIYIMTATQFSSNIKLEELHATYTSFGYCHYIGAFGYNLPPNRTQRIGSGGSEEISLQYGQLFFKLVS